MQSEIIKAAQTEGKLTILFDSGIRTGSDVIKALALGAQGVLRMFDSFFCIILENTYLLHLVGRPFAYGLALDGEAGAEAVIRSLLCDLEATLGLMGCASIADVQGRAEKILKKVA